MSDAIKDKILPSLIVPLLVGALGAVFGSQLAIARVTTEVTGISLLVSEVKLDVKEISREIADLKTEVRVNSNRLDDLPPQWLKRQVDDIEARIRDLEKMR